MGLLATDENNVIDYGANKKFPIEYSVKNKFLVLRAEVNANHEPNIKNSETALKKESWESFRFSMYLHNHFAQNVCDQMYIWSLYIIAIFLSTG